MSQFLMETAEVATEIRSGGLLGAALPAPSGWIRGLSIPFYGCGEPQIESGCVVANDVPGRGPTEADFIPFTISQGASCSTLSRIDQEKHAVGRLDSTTEWAAGQRFTAGAGQSLLTATKVGTAANADFTLAVSALEQAAANAGFGAVWWLHAPVRAAAYLADRFLINEGKSPSGAPFVISPGYKDVGPTTVRIWASGPVWAGVSDPYPIQAVDWRTNEDTAYAARDAIVAFDPCIKLYVDVTIPALTP